MTLVAQRHDGDRICISVTDTGIGMSEETRARLFSPFFTTKSDGTGLGLISCKRIAESYGGLIQVCSELGVGTRFDLILLKTCTGFKGVRGKCACSAWPWPAYLDR